MRRTFWQCRLLTKDPKKRPDARDALGHPWLKVTSCKNDGGDAFTQAISNEVLQNLSVFAASNKLQRVFMHLAVGFMHKNEMEKVLTMFSTLNTDRSAPMPASEIKKLLCKGRPEMQRESICKTVDVCSFYIGRTILEFANLWRYVRLCALLELTPWLWLLYG
jgi:hypothetical protein